jgi:Diguanylate cyclase, GGDEF domain
MISRRGVDFGDERVWMAPDQMSTPPVRRRLRAGHCASGPSGAVGDVAVTRVMNGRQLMLAVDAAAYDVVVGAHFPYADSLCRFMVSGSAPQIAPRVEDVADYAAAAAIAPITELVSGLLSAVLDADIVAIAIAGQRDLARRDAETDSLTGLLNRRAWNHYLLAEERHHRRLGDQACVIVIDLDQLKTVNDTYGHAAGDRYIAAPPVSSRPPCGRGRGCPPRWRRVRDHRRRRLSQPDR